MTSNAAASGGFHPFFEAAEDWTTRFSVKDKLGAGTYGTVYRAVCRDSGDTVAIKRIEIPFDDEGVPATALREISLLSECSHPNIILLHDVHSSAQSLYLVFECLDLDLRAYLRKYSSFDDLALRHAAVQCFRGIEFCHGNRIIHRDLKPQNVLLDVKKMRLKIADFGLARAFSLPLKAYTHEVVTLWYRCPEILLGQAKYGPHTDIWSLGCLLGEMATAKELFPGDSEIGTLFKIFRCLGTPTEDVWPGVGQLKDFKEQFPIWQDSDFNLLRQRGGDESLGHDGLHLLRQCLKYNDAERPSATLALRHMFFKDLQVCEDTLRWGPRPAAKSQPGEACQVDEGIC
jgi:serine/threonine protein kinase